jgi:uncharacterized protein YuzE
MAFEIKELNIKDFTRIATQIINLSEHKMSIDYDKEADVLYVSFNRPQKATDSVMTNDGILLRYRDDKLVGMTITEASKR